MSLTGSLPSTLPLSVDRFHWNASAELQMSFGVGETLQGTPTPLLYFDGQNRCGMFILLPGNNFAT